MKKVFFIIGILLISLDVLSQEKINVDNLIGYWTPNEKATELFFWKDKNNVLQVQEISSNSGIPLTLIDFVVKEDFICIKTIFEPTVWTTESVFVLIDDNTLKCTITGDGEGVVYYKKNK
jgi:hypothetical protein